MRIRISLAVMWLAAMLPAFGQAPGSTVRVKVQVVDPLSAAGVMVTLRPIPPPAMGADGLPETDLLAYLQNLAIARGVAPAAFASTDTLGDAVFQGVQPGKYSVTAARGTLLIAPGRSIDVFPGQPALEVSLVLTRVATITGRVIDPRGAPVANVMVVLGTLGLQNGQKTFVRAPLESTTNSGGEYVVNEIPPGDYIVRIQTGTLPGGPVYNAYNDDLNKAKIITVKAGSILVGLDIQLP